MKQQFGNLKVKVRPKRFKLYGADGYLGTVEMWFGHWEYWSPAFSRANATIREMKSIVALMEQLESESRPSMSTGEAGG